MSTRVWDATCHINTDDSLITSSNNYLTLLIGGDTIRLSTNRNPANDDEGELGEFCFGSVFGTTYLYYYTGSQWVRTAFSSY